MIIRCLFGQAKESYDGEHAPELICSIDEYVLEDNPAHWENTKKDALAHGYADNFISLKEVEVEVDQDKIRSILLSNPVVAGEVTGAAE